jgi:acetylornithine deacetylase/succinyl-diaminopimelate desuccinylase-like protein
LLELKKNRNFAFFGHTDTVFSNIDKPFELTEKDGNRIILRPGPITAHQDDEHITLKSLNECVEIYKKIINYICK